MTENEGDLISREALKEAVINNFDNLQAYFPKDFIEEIDNASTIDTDEIYKKGYHNGFFATHDVPPTVEPTYISDMPDDKVKDLQELAIDYGEGIAVFERKRPRGEWEHWGSPFSDEQVANSIVCSVCGARFVEIQDEVFNFCPNCGAEMQKGGVE